MEMTMSMRGFVFVGLLVSLILTLFLSPFASPLPDGLERVAQDKGFLEKGEGTPAIRAPLPDYAWPGVDSEGMATALAGFFGTMLTFTLGYSLALLLVSRRKGAKTGSP